MMMATNDYRSRFYDRYSSNHAAARAPTTINDLRGREPYLTRMVRLHFPPDRQEAILDLGCGHGALVHFARQAGYHNVCGVDISPEQVAEAHRLGIEGVRPGGVMESLHALPDTSQGAVITFDLIEHFDKAELIDLAEEIFRVLRPGGRWIIHTPNADSPFFGSIRYGDFTHEQAFTAGSLKQLISAIGFSQSNYFDDAPVAHGLRSFARMVIWAGFTAVLRLYCAAETGAFDRSSIFSRNLLAVAIK